MTTKLEDDYSIDFYWNDGACVRVYKHSRDINIYDGDAIGVKVSEIDNLIEALREARKYAESQPID